MPARKKLLVIATVFLEKKSSGTSPISMVSKSDTSLIASPLSDDSLAMSSPGNTLQTSRQSRKTSRQQSRKTSPLIKAEPSLTNENLMSAASPFPIPLLTIPVSESHVNGIFDPFKAHQNHQHPFSNSTQQQQQMNTVTDFLADLFGGFWNNLIFCCEPYNRTNNPQLMILTLDANGEQFEVFYVLPRPMTI